MDILRVILLIYINIIMQWHRMSLVIENNQGAGNDRYIRRFRNGFWAGATHKTRGWKDAFEGAAVVSGARDQRSLVSFLCRSRRADWSQPFSLRGIEMKSVRFLCDEKLLGEVDAYRSRYICRTEIIEAALRQYLKVVASNGGRLVGVKGWSLWCHSSNFWHRVSVSTRGPFDQRHCWHGSTRARLMARRQQGFRTTNERQLLGSLPNL